MKLKSAFLSLILIISAVFLLGGCTASQKDLATYKKDFIDKSNKFLEVHENNKKVMVEVRAAAKQGMKRTQVVNSIDPMKNQLELIQEDFSTSPVPTELEPLKTEVLKIIDLKIKAVDDLLTAYDLVNPSNFEQEADKKFAEADQLVQQFKVDLDKIKK